MSRLEAWWIHVSVLAVGGTGLVWAWMLYFMEPADEFALVNHALQPVVQSWHILSAPFLIVGAAVVWKTHVWKRVLSGFQRRRKSGLLLAVMLPPMALSGYLLQVAEGELAREIALFVHLGTSGWFCLGYPIHHALRRN